MTDAPHRVFYLSGGDLLRADDATLAIALMANDVRAPRVAWARFAPMVHRMLKRAFGPGHDIEDLVQDVFLCLFKKVEGLREPKALKSFVIAITTKTIQYEIRQRRVRAWVRLSKSPQMIVDGRTDQPDPAARQALARFYEVLGRLKTDDQVIFALRFFEGLELTEVAAALDISVATTKRRLDRIWKRLTLLVERNPGLTTYLRRADENGQRDGEQEDKEQGKEHGKQHGKEELEKDGRRSGQDGDGDVTQVNGQVNR
ncbi:MAG TPA: sigma-70 family RNA polymerase sigma factor [Polyangia bacterium]